MHYDTGLAQRIREQVEALPGTSEKEMFGGLSFFVNGNLAVGVIGGDLMVRVGPDQNEKALAHPAARPFNMTGKVMKGWVMVEPPGFEEDSALSEWVQKGIEFARSLPAK